MRYSKDRGIPAKSLKWALIVLASACLIFSIRALVEWMRQVNFPPPESISIEQYQLTGGKVGPNVRVDEKLYFDRDSFSSIFYGDVSEKDIKRFRQQESSSNSRPRGVLKVHQIGRETLIAVGRPNDNLEKRWKEIVSQEAARHRQQPRVIGRDILDADSKILGVQFGLTTTADLAKEFGPATVSDGSIKESLQTWNLKGLVIATDGRSSPSTGSVKVDLVSAMAWSGTLNEALKANDLKPLPVILGSLRVGQTRAEVEKLLKASPRDGTKTMTRIMIRQAGEKSVYGSLTWTQNQKLKSIHLSDSRE